MLLRRFLLGLMILSMNLSFAQSSLETQNKILAQFDHLIPKSSSFGSWMMYEIDFNGDKKKDYVFSYILVNKYKRHLHAGSGVLILTKDKNKKFKLVGHIPSSNKNIYSFSNYSNKVFYLNEYDASTNYRTIKKELKFIKKGEKFVLM